MRLRPQPLNRRLRRHKLSSVGVNGGRLMLGAAQVEQATRAAVACAACAVCGGGRGRLRDGDSWRKFGYDDTKN